MDRIKGIKEFSVYRKGFTKTQSKNVDCFNWYKIGLETADKECEKKFKQLKEVARQKSELIAEHEEEIRLLKDEIKSLEALLNEVTMPKWLR